MNVEPQIVEVVMTDIIPNRFQPRRNFDEDAINELAASIKEHGIIQPLVLRRLDDKYEIIAGERRYKAATIAGLTKVPAIITDLDDNKSAEVALVENIQRKDLTPIEEAKSYKNLLDRGYLTQEELAKKMGLSQSAISNKLRLLNLDEEVQDALLSGKISERHARSMLTVSDMTIQKELLKKVIDERMTVRQLDMEIKRRANNMVMDDAPIIDASPTVDEIKNVAVDINPVKESLPISELLTTETEKEAELNPIVSPEISVTAQPEQTKGRFFNFLEDEAVNLDMGDEQPSVAPAPSISNEPTVFPTQGSSPTPLFGSIDNISSLTDQPVVEQKLGETTVSKPSTTESLFDEPQSATVPLISQPETLVDPVSRIETLDPNYVAPTLPEETNKYNLSDAINSIRNVKDEIEKNGLVVEVEELDLEKLYQVIIKIDK